MRSDAHSKALNDLVRTPERFFVEHVQLVSREMELWERQRLLCAPDIVFVGSGHVSVLEYKATIRNKGHALDQLYCADCILTKMFRLPVRKFFVYGSKPYSVEEIF